MRPPRARARTARKAISYQSGRDIKAGDQSACFSGGCQGVIVFKWAGMPALTGDRGMAKKYSGTERRRFIRVNEEDLVVCEPFDTADFNGSIAQRTHTFAKSLSENGILFESVSPTV